MAEDTIYKQEFNIRNTETQSVTLYPTRAQVVRDIKDITLRVRTKVHENVRPTDTISLDLTRSQSTA